MRRADGASRRTGSRRLASFGSDAAGASAVEFAIVAAPFIYMLLGILQVGVFYFVQSALDAAVVRTADGLRNSFSRTAAPTLPSGSALKTTVVSNAGALVRNDASLLVEIRQLQSLDGGVVGITDGYTDYGTATSPLVLRARASVTTFAPGFSSLTTITSSAIVRRQGR